MYVIEMRHADGTWFRTSRIYTDRARAEMFLTAFTKTGVTVRLIEI